MFADIKKEELQMSLKTTEIRAADGSSIYIQYADEDVSQELQAVAALDNVVDRTNKFKESLKTAVCGYSEMFLNAVKQGMEHIQPDKLTLEFGIQMGGEAGFPLVTKGTAQANIKVTIEWNLKER